MGAEKGDLAFFPEAFGGEVQPLGVVEEGGHGRLNRLADDVPDILAHEPLEGGGVVQVLAVLHHLHDLHFQAGFHRLFQIFHRGTSERRGMDEHGDLGRSLARMVPRHVLGQADGLVGIAGDGQEDVAGILQIPRVKRRRNGGHPLFLEIPFQRQRAAGGIVQVKDDPLIQKFLEIPLGDVGFILVVPDVALDLVVAQQFHVVDVVEIVLHPLGVGVSGVGGGSRDGQGKGHLVDLGVGGKGQSEDQRGGQQDMDHRFFHRVPPLWVDSNFVYFGQFSLDRPKWPIRHDFPFEIPN